MTIHLRRDPRSTPTVSREKLKPLGRIGRDEYVVIAGSEYLLPAERASDSESWAPFAGQVLVAEPDVVRDAGQSHVIGSRYGRALPVPAGTYLRLASEQAAAEAAKERRLRPRPADSLAGLSALGGRQDRFFHPAAMAKNAFVPGREPIRGAVAIHDHLVARGARFSLTPAGKLLTRVPPGKGAAILDAAFIAERLIAGVIADELIACELEHDGEPPPAWTMIDPNLAACEQHARGEL